MGPEFITAREDNSSHPINTLSVPPVFQFGAVASAIVMAAAAPLVYGSGMKTAM